MKFSRSSALLSPESSARWSVSFIPVSRCTGFLKGLRAQPRAVCRSLCTTWLIAREAASPPCTRWKTCKKTLRLLQFRPACSRECALSKFSLSKSAASPSFPSFTKTSRPLSQSQSNSPQCKSSCAATHSPTRSIFFPPFPQNSSARSSTVSESGELTRAHHTSPVPFVAPNSPTAPPPITSVPAQS
jgi:hypothetical protein